MVVQKIQNTLDNNIAKTSTRLLKTQGLFKMVVQKIQNQLDDNIAK